MPVQSPQRDAGPSGPGQGSVPVTDSRPRVLRWAAAAVILGGFLVYNNATHPDGESPVSAGLSVAQPAPAVEPTTPATPAGPAMDRSEPTQLSIPYIGVTAPFTKLTIGSDGRLQAPPEDNSNLAGWYADGPTPGERGSAIVAGHVDTKTGPAVFFLLTLLKPGQAVDITRADGSVAHFTIDSVEVFAKNDFPDQRVYGETPDAQLRIITCGGTFDHAKQDYKDNVVVFAHLNG
jgi:hypothetical protein